MMGLLMGLLAFHRNGSGSNWGPQARSDRSASTTLTIPSSGYCYQSANGDFLPFRTMESMITFDTPRYEANQ